MAKWRNRTKSAVSGYMEILVSKAKKESGEIALLSNAKCIEDCITRFENKLVFWYNDSTGNTKVVDVELDF